MRVTLLGTGGSAGVPMVGGPDGRARVPGGSRGVGVAGGGGLLVGHLQEDLLQRHLRRRRSPVSTDP